MLHAWSHSPMCIPSLGGHARHTRLIAFSMRIISVSIPHACFEIRYISSSAPSECIVIVAVCMHVVHGMHPECLAPDCVSGSVVRLYFGVSPIFWFSGGIFCRDFFHFQGVSRNCSLGVLSAMRRYHAFIPCSRLLFWLLGRSCILHVALLVRFCALLFICLFRTLSIIKLTRIIKSMSN